MWNFYKMRKIQINKLIIRQWHATYAKSSTKFWKVNNEQAEPEIRADFEKKDCDSSYIWCNFKNDKA